MTPCGPVSEKARLAMVDGQRKRRDWEAKMKNTDRSMRPSGSNADEWRMFLQAWLGDGNDGDALSLSYCAVQIAEAIEAERERCAQLHESINPASDQERHNGDPGAGAMGAVIEYRDKIRGQK